MPGTPQEMVQQFCSVLPPPLTSNTLEEYGLELRASPMQRVLQEILSLSLFWTDQAFRVTLPEELASELREGIYQYVRDGWKTHYALDPEEEAAFFVRMPQQHAKWENIVKQGGEPIAVLGEAVSSLEEENLVGSQDHQKLLALYLDLVPIEEVGEIAGEIEEELAG